MILKSRDNHSEVWWWAGGCLRLKWPKRFMFTVFWSKADEQTKPFLILPNAVLVKVPCADSSRDQHTGKHDETMTLKRETGGKEGFMEGVKVELSRKCHCRSFKVPKWSQLPHKTSFFKSGGGRRGVWEQEGVGVKDRPWENERDWRKDKERKDRSRCRVRTKENDEHFNKRGVTSNG